MSMSRVKLFSLLFYDNSEIISEKLKDFYKKDQEAALKYHKETLDILTTIINDYSKEKLMDIMSQDDIIQYGLKKMTLVEQKNFWNNIDNVASEEVFFGKYLESFNGRLHFFALLATNDKRKDALYVNGLYYRHFSPTNSDINRVRDVVKAFDRTKGEITIIENNKDIDQFLKTTKDIPMWLKNVPNIENYIVIAEEFKNNSSSIKPKF